MKATFVNVVQPILNAHPEEFRGITFDKFLWAWMCVSSRTFGRFLPHPSLVPFADLLNHVNVHTSYEWDNERRAAVYRHDHQRVSEEGTGGGGCVPWLSCAGQEVFFSYGPRSNELLLLHYGFAIPVQRMSEAGVG